MALAGPPDQQTETISADDLVEEIALFGIEQAAVARASIAVSVRLSRVIWEERPASAKWDYAVAASAYLRERALRLGHPGAAAAALRLIEDSGEFTSDKSAAGNQLGLTRQALGYINRNEVEIGEAIEAYQEALRHTARGDPGFRLRVEINLAAALHLRADVLSDGELRTIKERKTKGRWLSEAEQLLRAALTDGQPLEEVDRPRAEETLGNVLTAQDRPADAIPLFDRAATGWSLLPKILDHARTQANLGAAYADVGQLAKALEACRKALKWLSPDVTPIPWIQAKYNEGRALLNLGLAAQDPDKKYEILAEAIAALKAIQPIQSRKNDPLSWGRTIVLLVNALGMLGSLLCDKHFTKERDKGKSFIHEALSIGYLFKEILDNKNKVICTNLLNELELINRDLTITDYGPTMDYWNVFKPQLVRFLDQLGVPSRERSQLLLEAARELAPVSPEAAAREITRDTMSPATGPSRDNISSTRPTNPIEEGGNGSDATIEQPSTLDGLAKPPMPPEARELFGEPPPASQPKPSRPKTYTKSDFPAEWFDNDDVVRAARRRAVDYKTRDKSVTLAPSELERFRAATRFIRAYERQQARRRAARTVATPT